MANKDVIEAVASKLGMAQDNLHRASASFRGLSPAEMAKEHGQSGATRAAILAEYQAEVDRWQKALASLGNS